MRFRLLLTLILLLIPAVALANAATTMTYTVAFESSWSQQTHPHPSGSLPFGAHYSSLIGATHRAAAGFWQPGDIATDGIEQMAERGLTAPLTAEIEAEIAGGDAFAVVSGPNLVGAQGVVSTTFEVSSDFPLVTLVTMIAPSPDWFVGVHDLALIDGDGEWLDELVVELYPYDAGSDSGSDYTSANANTQPPEPIASLQGVTPFSNAPMGSFTFRRSESTPMALTFSSATVGPAAPYMGLPLLLLLLCLSTLHAAIPSRLSSSRSGNRSAG